MKLAPAPGQQKLSKPSATTPASEEIDTAPLRFDWFRKIFALLVIAAGVLWICLGFGETRPADRAVPVQRAQQVKPLQDDSLLNVGDTVVVPGHEAPSIAKISAVPLQGIKGRDVKGSEYFVVLGADRYYVVADHGAGQVVDRSEIRGIVQTGR